MSIARTGSIALIALCIAAADVATAQEQQTTSPMGMSGEMSGMMGMMHMMKQCRANMDMSKGDSAELKKHLQAARNATDLAGAKEHLAMAEKVLSDMEGRISKCQQVCGEMMKGMDMQGRN